MNLPLMSGDDAPEDSPAGPPERRNDQLYLIDKSAWEQRRHDDAASGLLDTLVEADRVATCLPVALEILYSARSRRDFDDHREFLEALNWLPVTSAVEEAAIDLMTKLSRNGHHRIPPPDLTIAATALTHGAAVLHYDREFQRIAEITDLRQEWIVPPGTGHGRTTS